MENETGCDLNTALENWRQELAAHTSLTAENRRELETHLLDAMAGLKRTGLGDEESFWLARRRLGRPEHIAEEFAKADPLSFWRERLLWIAAGALACYGLTTSHEILSNLLDPFGQRTGIGLYFGLFALPGLILIGWVLGIRQGRMVRLSGWFRQLPKSPRWSATVLLAILLVIVVVAYFSAGRIGKSAHDMLAIGAMIQMGTTWIFGAIWPAMMILVLFLLPREPASPRKISKGV